MRILYSLSRQASEYTRKRLAVSGQRLAVCSVLCIAFVLFTESVVYAQSLPLPPCSFPWCNRPPTNVIVESAIPRVATLFLNSVAALSVIFVMVGGFRFVLSFGREEEYGKAVKTIIWALAGVVLALTSHNIVTIVLSEQYIAGGSDPIFEFFTSVVRIMTVLLNLTFMLVVISGGIRMVIARGKEESVTKGRKAVLYAIAGIIIINVAPFVVNAVIQL